MMPDVPQQSRLDQNFTARLATLAAAPIPPIAAFLAGNAVLPILVTSVVLSVLLFAARGLDHRTQALLVAVSVIGQCIAFTAALSGHPWQIDTHMAFFAALAIISTTGSIPALVLGVLLTAGHHVTFGLLLPALVYPSSGLVEVLGRTALHAFIVVFEAMTLGLSMHQSAKTAAEVHRARGELAESAAEATAAQAGAEAARERALAAAERIREQGRQAAVAVEEISVAARAAASNANESKKVVAQAQEDAGKSADIVGKTRGAMAAIKDSSDEISQIVAMIDEIARRTDLLALNAAVESARAGDAGRGFAVVANEVRKLAQQSADATTRIRALVSTSSHRVKEGADLVQQTGQALDRIAHAISDLDSMIGDIAAGAGEQSTGLEQVSLAINRIDEISIGDNEDVGTDHSFEDDVDLAAVVPFSSLRGDIAA